MVHFISQSHQTDFYFSFCTFIPQPGDDIVVMAQTLEKVFLQKVSQMPKEELVITAPSKELVKGRNATAGLLKMWNLCKCVVGINFANVSVK